MKKKMNKRGWIRVMESFLAVIIILGAVVVVMSRQPAQSNIADSVYEKQTQILEIISQDDNLRTEILAGNNENVNETISNLIPVTWGFSTAICKINEICSGDTPSGKEIYAKETIITSNLTTYDVKKLRFFVWVK